MSDIAGLAIEDRSEQLLLVLGRLDERQRRWVSGVLALMLNRGGISRVSRVSGLDKKTVARGRAEVLAGLENDPDDGRVRRSGGGRPRLEKKVPKSNRR